MNDIVHDQSAKLGKMAGQIADFFRAYPEEQAMRSIAEHINKFWSGRMRADFLAGPAPADPLVAKAFPLIRPPRRPETGAE